MKVPIFINTYQKKLDAQLNIILQLGYTPVLFVSTHMHVTKQFEVIELKTGFFARIAQCYRYFKKESIHHCEVYPGGRFTVFYILLCSLFSIPTLCVERGDLLYFHKNGYSLLTRISMYFVYRYSDWVWYREFYMREILERLHVRNLFFAHNVTELPSVSGHSVKDITFLWVNRLIDERYSSWFVDILNESDFAQTENALLGILETENTSEALYVHSHKPANLSLHGFINPQPFYQRASFFVLPAKVVFANHSLLEAMSYGVVPIVSEALGSDAIVQHQVNGFICKDKEDLKRTMLDVLHMDKETYRRMSENAQKTIRDEYSNTYLESKIKELYRCIEQK